MNLDKEELVEVMTASFPRERRVLMRVTQIREDEDGDLYVTLDPGERVVGVVSGQRLDMAWVSLGEDKEVEDLRRWKAEATAVIAEWDQLWEQAGRPGRLGDTRAAGLLKKLQERGCI